jgi:hypothetical protein
MDVLHSMVSACPAFLMRTLVCLCAFVLVGGHLVCLLVRSTKLACLSADQCLLRARGTADPSVAAAVR